jgi:excisionase family DNA binding protein
VLSSTEVAGLAGCSRFTVERACRNKTLEGKKVGRNWIIEDDEGKRWAEQYRPHARTGKKASAGADPAPGAETEAGARLVQEDLLGTSGHEESGSPGPDDGTGGDVR